MPSILIPSMREPQAKVCLFVDLFYIAKTRPHTFSFSFSFSFIFYSSPLLPPLLFRGLIYCQLIAAVEAASGLIHINVATISLQKDATPGQRALAAGAAFIAWNVSFVTDALAEDEGHGIPGGVALERLPALLDDPPSRVLGQQLRRADPSHGLYHPELWDLNAAEEGLIDSDGFKLFSTVLVCASLYILIELGYHVCNCGSIRDCVRTGSCRGGSSGGTSIRRVGRRSSMVGVGRRDRNGQETIRGKKQGGN